jgi:hypothetical protein
MMTSTVAHSRNATVARIEARIRAKNTDLRRSPTSGLRHLSLTDDQIDWVMEYVTTGLSEKEANG